MKNKLNTILMWVLAILPALILLAVYPRLPDIIPTNFGFDGTVNAYGPKATLWIFAGLNPLFALMFRYMPRLDPKRENYERFQKYFNIFSLFMELFMLVILCLILAEILAPGTVSIGRSITVLVAILFLVIGNMMGKIKHNYFFGIRTPWTLADPDIWTRTHSLGGKSGLFWACSFSPAVFSCPKGSSLFSLSAASWAPPSSSTLSATIGSSRKQIPCKALGNTQKVTERSSPFGDFLFTAAANN